jgi:hypothetical protein
MSVEETETVPQDIEGIEQESVLEPFDTPNPWLQKLFGMCLPTERFRLRRSLCSGDVRTRLVNAVSLR